MISLPQRTGNINRRKWQPLQSGPCVLVLILPTPGGWKAELFNLQPGQESNQGPQDWEAEDLSNRSAIIVIVPIVIIVFVFIF